MDATKRQAGTGYVLDRASGLVEKTTDYGVFAANATRSGVCLAVQRYDRS